MKLLKELYTTHSPTFGETLGPIIKRELKNMNIPYDTDIHGQIYNVKGDGPLLCAHMDQVQLRKAKFVIFERGDLYGVDKNGKLTGLGADDKNGVWIILQLLKKLPDTNFIFSTGEEAGGNIQYLLQTLNLDGANSKDVNFGLVFDRKGGNDIIGSHNGYCQDDLIEALEALSGNDYEEAVGTFSDCDHLNKYMPCVNISCGYNRAHTVNEFTHVAHLEKALDFGLSILMNLSDVTFAMPKTSVFDRFPAIQRPKIISKPAYPTKSISEWDEDDVDFDSSGFDADRDMDKEIPVANCEVCGSNIYNDQLIWNKNNDCYTCPFCFEEIEI